MDAASRTGGENGLLRRRHRCATVEALTNHLKRGVRHGYYEIGVDLAKRVFAVHGVDVRGNPVLRKTLRREQMVPFFTRLQPCVVAMEACASAHFWARKLESLGHTVKLIAPQFVKPYVKGNKHDAADAAAICEAASRPSMRFVAVKTPRAQTVLALHRFRDGFVKTRTVAQLAGGIWLDSPARDAGGERDNRRREERATDPDARSRATTAVAFAGTRPAGAGARQSGADVVQAIERMPPTGEGAGNRTDYGDGTGSDDRQ